MQCSAAIHHYASFLLLSVICVVVMYHYQSISDTSLESAVKQRSPRLLE